MNSNVTETDVINDIYDAIADYVVMVGYIHDKCCISWQMQIIFCKTAIDWTYFDELYEHMNFRRNYSFTNYNIAMFTFPIRIFYRGVPCFAPDCPCGVWCRGLTACPLHVGPFFWKTRLKWYKVCKFDIKENIFFIIPHPNALQYDILFSFALFSCL